MDDKMIIDLFWERSEKAIAETSAKYGSFCHSISYRILHNAQDAEECVNDTWLHTWDSIPPHKPKKLSVYLGRITRNLSLDRYKNYNAEKRKMTRTAEALDELSECISGGDNVSEYVDKLVLKELIESFLHKQTEEKRNIFVRRYWYFDSIHEISAAYGISETNVSTILLRMRAQLRSELQKEGIEV